MITVYTTPACPGCMMTKKKLDDLGIRYEVVDMSTNVDSLDYVRSLGYTQAPVVITEDSAWSGFQPDRLRELV